MIRVGSDGSGATGSGFVIDTDGHIMTNNHVVAGAADGGRITVVFSDGSPGDGAELVGRSPSYDLAVIKLSGSHPLTPLPVGDSETVRSANRWWRSARRSALRQHRHPGHRQRQEPTRGGELRRRG